MSSFSRRDRRRGCGWRGPGPGTDGGRRSASGRPSSRPSARTSSLNSSRSGSTSFMFMRSGRPPTLWCALDRHRRAAGERHALDHVGIERALRQELGAADLLRLRLEHVDEQPADGLALGLGVGDAGERLEEQVRGVGMDQRDVVVVAEQRARPRSASSCAQQAVVDEHAGELVADRLVDQHRRDRANRRRPTGRRSPCPCRPGRGCARSPRRGTAAIVQSPRAAGDPCARSCAAACAPSRRVHDLGVELHGRRSGAPRRRSRRRARSRDGRSTAKPGGSCVTRSPWLIQTCLRSPGCHTPSNSAALGLDLDLGAAELAVVAALDLAAELLRHGLLAVADAEHRHAGVEDRLRRAGRPAVDAPRPGRRRG